MADEMRRLKKILDKVLRYERWQHLDYDDRRMGNRPPEPTSEDFGQLETLVKQNRGKADLATIAAHCAGGGTIIPSLIYGVVTGNAYLISVALLLAVPYAVFAMWLSSNSKHINEAEDILLDRQ